MEIPVSFCLKQELLEDTQINLTSSHWSSFNVASKSIDQNLYIRQTFRKKF